MLELWDWIWHLITYNDWYAIKLNKTNQTHASPNPIFSWGRLSWLSKMHYQLCYENNCNYRGINPTYKSIVSNLVNTMFGLIYILAMLIAYFIYIYFLENLSIILILTCSSIFFCFRYLSFGKRVCVSLILTESLPFILFLDKCYSSLS